MERYQPGAAEQFVLSRILEERRVAAAEPEKRRYEQAERHHRAWKRSAWFAAGVSVVGALASWASVCFSPPRRSKSVD
jgi:hypothetical protein